MGPLAAFQKYEGLGNDFIVVDVPGDDALSGGRAQALCDRRRGIGGDGVLLLSPSRTSGVDARMRVVNADGSVPEMCGNGLRCAVLHLARRRDLDRGALAIETDAGVRRCTFERAGDGAMVLADMGLVRVQGDVVLEVGGERVSLTRADAGNPHAVALRSIRAGDLERLGRPLSVAPTFERGANIEFAHPVDGVLDVLVWERGAGATLACGTGACAAVAVACAKGVVSADGPVRVRLPGGELEVRHDPVTGQTSLRGPARYVFAGSIGAL
jgi:diaminopimelate epimerase